MTNMFFSRGACAYHIASGICNTKPKKGSAAGSANRISWQSIFSTTPINETRRRTDCKKMIENQNSLA